MAVLIGGIAPRATATDIVDGRQLEGAFGVHALVLDGRSFVYVAGLKDGGISAFELGSDGSLTGIQDMDDGLPTSPLELSGAANFASATVNGKVFLYVNGGGDDGISVFQVAASGTLTNVNNVADDEVLLLDDAAGRMAVATVGAFQYLIVSAKDDNGISIFRIGDDGELEGTANVPDSDELWLKDAVDVATVVVGDDTFFAVVSEDDDSLSIFQLHGGGTVTNTYNLLDDDTLNLRFPFSVASATVGGTAYLITTGASDSGLSVFTVDGAGQLENVFNLSDSPTLGLAVATGVTAFAIEGEWFVTVSSFGDNALGVFHLGAGGVLTELATIFDDAGLALNGSYYNAFAPAGRELFLLGTGYYDNGLSSFDFGGGNDVLTGTVDSDLLMGFGGDDVLDGGGADDRMLGGAGDDTYVVGSAGDLVSEQADAGLDMVHTFVSLGLGNHVENLMLLGGDGLDGMGNGLDNRITGNAGANRLLGEDGNDLISAGDGADVVLGGTGNDSLMGERAKDVLFGEAGGDDLNGGHGNDRLIGGQGNDDLLGGSGRDFLQGGAGRDDFIFTTLRSSGISNASRDLVDGFGKGDRIVLRSIDAIAGRGNQAFDLNRNGSFFAGEIRQRDVAGGLLVEMNVDNDARPEMSLFLKGFHHNLLASDFLF